MPGLTAEEKKRIASRKHDDYHRRAMRVVALRFHKRSDKDILDRIDSQANKTDYIRQLIRKDIEENG